MAAVQARLARRTLPRLTQDDLIEYSLPLHATARRTALTAPTGIIVDFRTILNYLKLIILNT